MVLLIVLALVLCVVLLLELLLILFGIALKFFIPLYIHLIDTPLFRCRIRPRIDRLHSLVILITHKRFHGQESFGMIGLRRCLVRRQPAIPLVFHILHALFLVHVHHLTSLTFTHIFLEILCARRGITFTFLN